VEAGVVGEVVLIQEDIFAVSWSEWKLKAGGSRIIQL